MKTIEQTTYLDIQIKSTKYIAVLNQGSTNIVIEKRNINRLIDKLKEFVND